MTTDERKFVLTALEQLRDAHAKDSWLSYGSRTRIEAAIKALEIALGL